MVTQYLRSPLGRKRFFRCQLVGGGLKIVRARTAEEALRIVGPARVTDA